MKRNYNILRSVSVSVYDYVCLSVLHNACWVLQKRIDENIRIIKMNKHGIQNNKHLTRDNIPIDILIQIGKPTDEGGKDQYGVFDYYESVYLDTFCVTPKRPSSRNSILFNYPQDTDVVTFLRSYAWNTKELFTKLVQAGSEMALKYGSFVPSEFNAKTMRMMRQDIEKLEADDDVTDNKVYASNLNSVFWMIEQWKLKAQIYVKKSFHIGWIMCTAKLTDYTVYYFIFICYMIFINDVNIKLHRVISED